MTKLTPKKKGVFLEKLAEHASVSKAAKAIRVSRETLYKHKRSDVQFSKEWENALDIGTDALEDEAVRRAKDGTEKPVFHQGKRCGAVREFSDTLLMFLLKARRPEKFRENTSYEASLKSREGEVVSFTLNIGDKGEG